MNYTKSALIKVAGKVQSNVKLTPEEVDFLCGFERKTKKNTVLHFLQLIALPLSLFFGFLFTVFPQYFTSLEKHLPSWTNFSPPLLSGVDYLWDLIGEPVNKTNIIYHIPNIFLYSFGIFGVKKIFETLDKKTWLDKVLSSKTLLSERISKGSLNIDLKKGHSILFVGNGDFIGAQFMLSHPKDMSITVSEHQPSYTNIWNFYNPNTTYQDLNDVILRSGDKDTGEYIFFPVIDTEVFLPPPNGFDLSPHKLDILCQDIRKIEKENKWKIKRIIIVGDKYHQSFVQSEDKETVLRNTKDVISLESIVNKYPKVTLIDPTDLVLKNILKISKGRKIVFRATKEGIATYKKRFFDRLEKLGYKHPSNKKGILTIGYDLSEDLTEQQTLTKKIDDYYPVILSKNVFDALIRNGYKKNEFIYVPELVLSTLKESASKQ